MGPIEIPVFADVPVAEQVETAETAEGRFRIIKAFLLRDGKYTHLLEFTERTTTTHMLTPLEPLCALVNGEIKVRDIVPTEDIENALPEEQVMPDSSWFAALNNQYRVVIVVFDDELTTAYTRVLPHVAVEIKDPPSRTPSVNPFDDSYFQNEDENEDEQLQRAVLASLESMWTRSDEKKDQADKPAPDSTRESTVYYDAEEFDQLQMMQQSEPPKQQSITTGPGSSLYLKTAIQGAPDLRHFDEDRKDLTQLKTQCFGNEAAYADARYMVAASTSGEYQHAFRHPGIYAQSLVETFIHTKPMHWSSLSALQTAFATMNIPIQASTTFLAAELQGNMLRILSVGSCQVAVLRKAEFIFLSPAHWEDPTTPVQFKTGQRISQDIVRQYDVEVAPNDVVIVGTDGFFDQLFPKRIELLIGKSGFGDVKTMAERLVTAAYDVMYDQKTETPCSDRWKPHGFTHQGCRLDDMTVIVGMVMRRDTNTQK